VNQTAGRVAGAGAAVVVLAALPLIIGAAGGPQSPPPAAGALSVDLADGADHYTIEVAGPSPAPTGSAVLRDTSGRHTGTVRPRASGTCSPASRRTAFDAGTTPWCLDLSDVAAGRELAGKVVNGGGDALTLTVRRRDAFVPAPLATLLLGLLAGILAALVPRWLRTTVRWLVLSRLVAGAAKPGAAGYVDGLTEWVRRRLKEGAGREAVLAAVHRVTSSGPERARLAREDLRAALGVAIPDHEFTRAAARVAADTTNRIGDFYSGMTELPAHPASEWAAGLARMRQYRTELDNEELRMAAIGHEHDGPAKAAFREAWVRFEALREPDDLPGMEVRLDDLRTAVDRGIAAARTMRGAEDGAAVPYLAAPRGPLEAALVLALRPGRLTGMTWIAGLLTALVLVLALGYAFLTIKQAAYDAKPLFAHRADYLALFSAALASGVGATVLALLGNWRPATGEDDG
jgi:hypothetical protein